MVVFFLEFFENIILFVSGKFWIFELGFFIEWKVFKVVFSILLLKYYLFCYLEIVNLNVWMNGKWLVEFFVFWEKIWFGKFI